MEAVGTNGSTCEACGRQPAAASYCESCDAVFCDPCWDAQIPHRKGKKGLTGVAHEKANFTIAKRLENILTPTSDPIQQQKLHQDDIETAWFGVVRDGSSAKPGLHDYGRYQWLMQASFNGSYAERWPQLVSFIGQTGDGKSTLIKMLIDQQIQAVDSRDEPFPTPVVGAVDSSNPTSGDVHLYADPQTFYEQFPIMFADSEGLKGGEKVPLGDRSKNTVYHHHPESLWRDGGSAVDGRPRPKLLRKAWDIQWADNPSKRRREYAVRHLYPRFLYTFSDVVVYVLRNERTFEAAALSHLLQWAAKSIEGSINQPALPHAVIAFNATDHVLPDSEWEVESATQKLLTGLDSTLETNPSLVKYVEFWRQSGRIIKNTEDLVRCYYSSFRVVRIPAKGRYMLIDSQIRKLRSEIAKCCKKSHKSKIRRRLDLNADELAETLLSGFDHFSNNLERPFDFIELSWNLNPIPQGFAGNILRLALNIKETCIEMNGPQIFFKLSNMAASCIMLDYVRHRIKGTAEQLLKYYKPSLDQVLKEFCNSYWPCNYAIMGRSASRTCVNTYRGHSKGHQDASGKVFGMGPYQSDFSADEYLDTWHSLLNDALSQIRRQMERASLQKTGTQESQVASQFHLERMNSFYGEFEDIDQFSSHSACFCCLRELPEYPLPCGHTICLPCVKAFGTQKSSTAWFLDHCPLHSKDGWGFRSEFRVKPHMAGIRVLSLDGGGMRGIVQLQVLAAIERQLGGIPVQDFFDLIVGTSAGGIISLGLGVKEWPVQECIRRFKTVSQKAFSPREFHGLAVLGTLATLHHQAKYKTRPLEEGLEESFGQESLFGGSFHKPRSTKKVAVVTTTEAGQGPLILANYNRSQVDHIPYRFERPERKDAEFKVWEAARATSAAPPYFKPFQRANSRKAYLDGALYFNCPIKVADTERKLLYPDVEDRPPDFVLSIGTGRNQRAIDREKLRRKGTQISSEDGASIVEDRKRIMGVKIPRFLQVLKDRVHNILDTQLAWEQFFFTAPGDFRRYARFNPELPELPALDEVDKMLWLEEEVKELLAKPQMANTISRTVRCLFASSFYFEKSFAPAMDDRCVGHIRCRFQDDSQHVKKVAEYLSRCALKGFRPFFTVEEEYGHTTRKRIIPLPDDVFYGMKRQGAFELPEIEISCPTTQFKTMMTFCFDRGGERYPISGFPRNLMGEDALLSSREDERQAALRNIRAKSIISRASTPRSGSLEGSQLSVKDDASSYPSGDSGRSTPDPLEPRESMESDSSFVSVDASLAPSSTKALLTSISEADDPSIPSPKRVPGRSTWSNTTTSARDSLVSEQWRYSQDSLLRHQLGEQHSHETIRRDFQRQPRNSVWSMARPDSCTIPGDMAPRPPPALPRLDERPGLSLAPLSPLPHRPSRVSRLPRSSTAPLMAPLAAPLITPVSPVSMRESGTLRSPISPVSATHSRTNSGASSLASWAMVPPDYTPPRPPPPVSPDTEDESEDVVVKRDGEGRVNVRYMKPQEPGWL